MSADLFFSSILEKLEELGENTEEKKQMMGEMIFQRVMGLLNIDNAQNHLPGRLTGIILGSIDLEELMGYTVTQMEAKIYESLDAYTSHLDSLIASESSASAADPADPVDPADPAADPVSATIPPPPIHTPPRPAPADLFDISKLSKNERRLYDFTLRFVGDRENTNLEEANKNLREYCLLIKEAIPRIRVPLSLLRYSYSQLSVPGLNANARQFHIRVIICFHQSIRYILTHPSCSEFNVEKFMRNCVYPSGHNPLFGPFLYLWDTPAYRHFHDSLYQLHKSVVDAFNRERDRRALSKSSVEKNFPALH